MTHKFLPMALLMVVVFCAAGVAAEKEEEFVPIFNGKDLSGWEGEPGFWSVQDGAITAINPAEKPIKRLTFLMWRGGTVDDFELRFSYRIPTGNSGVQFRSRELENWDVAGCQADFNVDKRNTGCLYDCNSYRADRDPRDRSAGAEGHHRRRGEANAHGHRRSGQAAGAR